MPDLFYSQSPLHFYLIQARCLSRPLSTVLRSHLFWFVLFSSLCDLASLRTPPRPKWSSQRALASTFSIRRCFKCDKFGNLPAATFGFASSCPSPCILSQHSSAVLMLISCWLSAHVNRRRVELAVAGAEGWGGGKAIEGRIVYLANKFGIAYLAPPSWLAAIQIAWQTKTWQRVSKGGQKGAGGRGLPYCFPSKYSSHAVTNSRLSEGHKA